MPGVSVRRTEYDFLAESLNAYIGEIYRRSIDENVAQRINELNSGIRETSRTSRRLLTSIFGQCAVLGGAIIFFSLPLFDSSQGAGQGSIVILPFIFFLFMYFVVSIVFETDPQFETYSRQEFTEIYMATTAVSRSIAFFFIMLYSFALVYFVVDLFSENAFNKRLTLGESLYFAVVTSTTLGYGDILPVGAISRALVATNAVLGLLFFVGILLRVRIFVEHELREDAKISALIEASMSDTINLAKEILLEKGKASLFKNEELFNRVLVDRMRRAARNSPPHNLPNRSVNNR